jgi:excisionase family DNA binding protein
MSTAVSIRPLLTVNEAAQLLGVSTKQVRRLIAQGELPALQLGGPGSAMRIDRDELVRWLYSSSEGPSPHDAALRNPHPEPWRNQLPALPSRIARAQRRGEGPWNSATLRPMDNDFDVCCLE